MKAARFVLDNSVTMAWCFEDEANKYADAVLDSLEIVEAIAPAVWTLELGNVVVVAQRNKRLTKADAVRFLTLVNSLPILVEQESPQRMLQEIVALARDQRLSTYDASYLDLAMRLGVPLATRDTSLLRAAKKCQVTLYRPER